MQDIETLSGVESIGSVELKYGENHELVVAAFHPLIKIRHGCSLAKGLGSIKHDAPEQIKQAADLVLAAWFAKVSRIELADREAYEVVGEVLQCDKDASGYVAKVIINYNLKARQSV